MAANRLIVNVRQASIDFLAVEPPFKLLFEAYTRCHPENMGGPHAARAREGWWNRANVLVRDAGNRLPPVLPVLHPSGELFYQDGRESGTVGRLIILEAALTAPTERMPAEVFARAAICSRQNGSLPQRSLLHLIRAL
jgi:hypothetical protein